MAEAFDVYEAIRKAAEARERRAAENKEAKKKSKSLYRSLVFKVHGDHLPADLGIEDNTDNNIVAKNLRERLMVGIWDKHFQRPNSGERLNDNDIEWTKMLSELKVIEKEINEFSAKVDARKAKKTNAGAKKTDPYTAQSKEFKEKFDQLKKDLLEKLTQTDLSAELAYEQLALIVKVNDLPKVSNEKKFEKLQEIEIGVNVFLEKVKVFVEKAKNDFEQLKKDLLEGLDVNNLPSDLSQELLDEINGLTMEINAIPKNNNKLTGIRSGIRMLEATAIKVETFLHKLDVEMAKRRADEEQAKKDGTYDDPDEYIELFQKSIGPDGKQLIERDAAKLVLHKVKSWSELNVGSADLSDEDIKKRARELEIWKEFYVHGMGRNNDLKERTDLDGNGALEMFRLAGIPIDAEMKNASGKKNASRNIFYLPKGDYKKGGVTLDSGNKDGLVIIKEADGSISIIADHHGKESGRRTSATEVAWNVMRSYGLIEDSPGIGKFIYLVNQVDNFDYPNPEEYFKKENYFNHSWDTMLGIQGMLTPAQLLAFFGDGHNSTDEISKLGLSDEKLKEYGIIQEGANVSKDDLESFQNIYGLKKEKGRWKINNSKEKELKKNGITYNRKENRLTWTSLDIREKQKKAVDKSRAELERMEKDGFIIDSSFGKIAIDVGGKIYDKTGASKAFGCDIYLNFIPGESGFFMSSLNGKPLVLDGKSFAEKFGQGKLVRDTMWLDAGNETKNIFDLKNVLNEMCGGNFQATGELAKYLEGVGTANGAGKGPDQNAQQKESKERFSELADELRKKLDAKNFSIDLEGALLDEHRKLSEWLERLLGIGRDKYAERIAILEEFEKDQVNEFINRVRVAELEKQEEQRQAEELKRKRSAGEKDNGVRPEHDYEKDKAEIKDLRSEDWVAKGWSEKEQNENVESIEFSFRLDEARKAYVKAGIDVDKKTSFFSKMLKLGRRDEELGQFYAEFERAKKDYEDASKNYKDFLTRTMIEQDVDTDDEKNFAKDDAWIIAKYFKQGEFFAIESVRSDLAVENSSWPEAAKKGYVKMIERYKKCSFKQKLVIAGILGGAGVVAGAAGAGAVAGGIVWARRVLGASVSSLGYSNLFEMLAEKRINKETNVSADKLVDEHEANIAHAEFDIEEFSKSLDNEIENFNNELNNRDLDKRWRGYGAVAAGVATSLLGYHIGKASSHLVGDAVKYWSGVFGHHEPAIVTGGAQDAIKSSAKAVIAEKAHEASVVHPGHTPTFDDAVKESAMEKAAEPSGDLPSADGADHVETFKQSAQKAGEFAPISSEINPASAEAAFERHLNEEEGESMIKKFSEATKRAVDEVMGQTKEVAKENVIVIKQGGSIESSIRDFYRHNPDALSAYQEAVGKKLTPGQIAHRMFLEYGDDRDLVHAKAVIHLSADGQDIVRITDDPNMGHLKHAVSGHVATPSHEDITPVAETAKVPTEIPVVETINPTIEVPDFKIDENFLEGFTKIDHDIDIVNTDVAKFDSAILDAYHQIDTSGHLTPEEIMKLNVDDIRPFNALDMTKSPEMMEAEKVNLKYLINQRAFLGEQLNKLVEGRSIMNIRNISKYIGGGSMLNWGGIQNQSMEQLLSNGKEPRVSKFFDYLMKSEGAGMNKLRETIKPKTDETVNTWIFRIVKTANVLGIKRI